MPSTNGEHEYTNARSPGRGYSCIRAKFVDGLLAADDEAGTGLWVYPPTILGHTRQSGRVDRYERCAKIPPGVYGGSMDEP